ncbi:hypothetical protein CEXT_11851 [Caerostris extrusa]|uniref:Uncharacterized protein n=1 Tax=Caerostris extrusa TaxID=172846 RepID=A0AAV4XBR8_CAEEX|nr:hypothetical protein CEXT_11851 [Caerostris extrusa]
MTAHTKKEMGDLWAASTHGPALEKKIFFNECEHNWMSCLNVHAPNRRTYIYFFKAKTSGNQNRYLIWLGQDGWTYMSVLCIILTSRNLQQDDGTE